MCLFFRNLSDHEKSDKFNKEDSLLPDYEFNIQQYRYLLKKNMGEVMRELNIYYPLMTFIIVKEGSIKRSENRNIFILYINDKHQVVDIIKGGDHDV